MDWISVKEKLPEASGVNFCKYRSKKEVLLTNGKDMYKGFLVERWEDAWQRHEIGIDGYELKDITHWMPLPNLP
jgi:hypothetical protein